MNSKIRFQLELFKPTLFSPKANDIAVFIFPPGWKRIFEDYIHRKLFQQSWVIELLLTQSISINQKNKYFLLFS